MSHTSAPAGPADTDTATSGSDFTADSQPTSLAGAARGYVDRLKGGDMGALPAVLGLLVLFAVFSSLEFDSFTSPRNIAALITQAGAICVLAMGLVPVLLLGDIDLSAGVAGGACAAVIALLAFEQEWVWYAAVAGGVGVGALIGLIIGFLVAKVGIPAFVVTLAFFLGLQGVTLWMIGDGASVPVRDEALAAISNDNLPIAVGYGLAALAIAAYAGLSLNRYRVASSRGLQRPPLVLIVLRILALALIVFGLTAVLSLDRAPAPSVVLAGVPYVVPLVAVLLIVLTFVFGRTAYGRYVYAVGGNKEAARRAGINVDRIRMSVFALCTAMAAISGLITASRLGGVTPDAGGGNVLLYAVGAAVIGGTSLFGGRGHVRDAIIGGLVIATIDNGLGLIVQDAFVKFIVTGLVLLLAATVDALSRSRRASTGT